MSGDPEVLIRDRAIAWHLQLQTADDTEWLAFTQWLEEDPRHNDAYEMVADADGQLDADFALLRREPVEPYTDRSQGEYDEFEALEAVQAGRFSRYRWPAVAASVAVAGLLGISVLLNGSDRYEISTSNGETRAVILDDGSQIALNGDTRITLDHDDARFAELDYGEAQFTVVHDPSDPFTVHVAGQDIVDVGTIFNVVHAGGIVSLGVADGAVQYRGKSSNVTLRQGETLVVAPNGNIRHGRRDAAAIGGWTRKMLQYDGARYQIMADDLQRSLGVEVSVDPALSERIFTGVIQTNGNKMAVRKRIETLLGVTIEVTPEGWKIEP